MTNILTTVGLTRVTEADDTKRFPLGTCRVEDDGKEYIYVTAGAAITQYAYVCVDEAYSALNGTKALVDVSHKIGFAPIAFTSGQFGWVQVKGVVSNALVKASCAADAVLYTSATAGYLDDDATSQTKVAGVVLTTSRGGTDGVAPAFAAIEPFADR